MIDRPRIIFTCAKGFVSWFIRRLGRDRVSHVGIMVGGMVISAERDGVIEQSLDDFLGTDRHTVYVFETTEEGAKHLDLVHARTLLGTKYGYKTLPGFAVAEAFDTENPWGDKALSVVCSEFVLYADDETGFITEWLHLNKEATRPQKLANRMLKGGPTFKRVA